MIATLTIRAKADTLQVGTAFAAALSAAGLTLAAGTDLGTVSALPGHSSVALTTSTYVGVAPSLKRAAADRLVRLMGRGA